MEVETQDGPVLAEVGDFLVERLVFDYRVMKPDEFEKMYDRANDVLFTMSRRFPWVMIPLYDFFKLHDYGTKYYEMMMKEEDHEYFEKENGEIKNTLDRVKKIVEKWESVYALQEMAPVMEKLSEYFEEHRK